MAYSVHNFEQGDILYASQLNEMDAQIALNEENISTGISADMLAEDYSANKTYSIGDYVIYNDELYVCIYEITAPEGWNSAHWQIANLGDGISNLKNAVNTSFALKYASFYRNEVQSGDDLDDYISAGNYRIPSDSIASNLLHNPTGVKAGRLTVLDLYYPNRLVQEIFTWDLNKYTRFYNGTSWSDWTEDINSNNVGFVTPEMYGAKGDGTVDDTAAFQRAIADASTKQIPLMLSGNYYITSTITVPSTVTVVSVNDHENAPRIRAKSDIGVLFDCTGVQNTFSNVDVSTKDNAFHEFTAFRFTGDSNGNIDSILKDVIITYAGVGVLCKGRNLDIIGGLISHCQYGVHVDIDANLSAVRGININGVRFHGTGEEYTSGTEQIVSGNCASIWLEADKGTNVTQLSDVTIRNCIHDQGGTFVKGNAQNCMIANNDIKHFRQPAIIVSGYPSITTPSGAGSWTISNNYFCAVNGLDAKGINHDWADYAITINGYGRINIAGNTFGRYKKVLSLSNAENISFVGNAIESLMATPLTILDISSSEIDVISNTFQGLSVLTYSNLDNSLINFKANSGILYSDSDEYKMYILGIGSGASVSFADGADNIPIKDLTVDIDLVQSGSGDPSPTNFRQITAWESVDISVAGSDILNPLVYQVSWASEAGVIYNGTLRYSEDTGWVLTANKVGGNSFTWARYNDTHCFYVKPTGYDSTGLAISEVLPSVNTGTFADFVNLDYGVRTSNYIYVTITGCNTSDDVNAWLASHNANIVYDITPRTYYLTNDTIIKTFLGENHISADTGNITVAYRADTTTEINTIKNAIDELEDTIETQFGSEQWAEQTTTYTAGYAIATSGATAGNIIESSSNSVSDKIYVGNASKFVAYYSGTNPYGGGAVYDDNDICLYVFSTVAADSKQELSLAGASYVRAFGMTSRINAIHIDFFTHTNGEVDTKFAAKFDKNQGAANAGKALFINDTGLVEPKAIDISGGSKASYMIDTPRKPLLAEFMSHFWCSMVIPDAFTGKNVVLTVSGNAGSDELTVSAISPDTLSFSDMGTDQIGGLLSVDDETYSVCNFRYLSGSTIKIYPALTENVTNGTISTLMLDSGRAYVGLHLTENGYKAYMQYLYGQNPKHCEVGKYIARFRGDLDTDHPWTWYGGTINQGQYRYTTANLQLTRLNRPTKRAYCFQYSPSWSAHTTKSGATWTVDLKGKSGYLEAFVFAIAPGLTLPTDQEIHIIVTIDGVEEYNEIVSDTICRRVIVDYETAETGTIEVYSNKWAAIDGSAYGFGFGRVTWWVNDLEYPDGKLFPEGAVIAEQFDSWGVYHEGASGKELERLHNAATGVSVPFTNNSKGDQTSAWGKAWFYDKTKQYNPSICIHDFVINDTNSMTSAGIPASIEGPDGVEYNNKLTSEQYSDNMILLGKLAISNGIQPIFMRNLQHGSTTYYEFSNALIDAMSEEVT